MNSVIIVAAGSGKRMNLGFNKQYLKLNDKEVIAHTIDVFYNNPNINEIVVCIKKDEEEFFKKNIIEKYNFENIKLAYGGEERQDSINNGLQKIDKNCEIVLIHDGARPFVDDKIINESIIKAKETGAVVVGVLVRDTIKVVNQNIIENTPDRSTLWSAQTPQTFDYKLIMKAYKKAYETNYYGTDDSMLVENIGKKVSMIEGSYENIKITTQEDIGYAEYLLNKRR
jgi:2-C-methyl-D-erythritol 4-phosphate cytidylyltransferase